MLGGWENNLLQGGLILIPLIIGVVRAGPVQEYCFPNKFNATCPPDHVVLMEEASYGRMRVGKCIVSPVNVGCGVDVLKQVDKRCSGRPTCVISIPDTELYHLQNCPTDLSTYLAAAYSCVKVISPQLSRCLSPQPITEFPGYLTSYSTGHTPIPGSGRCRYDLLAPHGQKINITLLDFGVVTSSGKNKGECIKYGRIKDFTHGEDRLMCGGRIREHNVYTSKGNKVTIELNLPDRKPDATHYMVKYEVVGCTDPSIPADSWFKRDSIGAVVECNFTNQKWHIICKDNKWVGTLENCTNDTARRGKTGTGASGGAFSFSLLIAVVFGIGLGIVLGITLLLVVSCILKWRRQRNNSKLVQNTLSAAPDHTFMLQSKPYQYDHSYECTNTNSTNSSTITSPPTLPGVIPTEECNINCPYNTMVVRADIRKNNLQKPTVRYLQKDKPAIIKDTAGTLPQQVHFWDNSNTTCACPVDDSAPSRTLEQNRSSQFKNSNNNEDNHNPTPYLSQSDSITA